MFQHAAAPLKSLYGHSTLHCYAYGAHEEDNILCIEAGDYRVSRLVRVQSACYTAEIFRSTDCDCHGQLDSSLRLIHDEGGLLVYMLADGRGAGLLTKVRGLRLGMDGFDTFDAYRQLGVDPDPRSYWRVVAVLKDLGLFNVRLLSNNPRKIAGIEQGGITVERQSLEIPVTEDSAAYLRTKREKFGHLLAMIEATDPRTPN